MKLYYKIMGNTFFYLGDLVSRPLNWDWMNSEAPTIVWLASANYNVYNWLMLKSVYYDDIGDLDIWTPVDEDEK